MSGDFQSLIREAPKVAKSCCYCPNVKYCFTSLGSDPRITWKYDDKDEWLLRLRCIDCKTSWGVCYTCDKTKAIFEDKRQISRHRFLRHNIASLWAKSQTKQVKADDDSKADSPSKQVANTQSTSKSDEKQGKRINEDTLDTKSSENQVKKRCIGSNDKNMTQTDSNSVINLQDDDTTASVVSKKENKDNSTKPSIKTPPNQIVTEHIDTTGLAESLINGNFEIDGDTCYTYMLNAVTARFCENDVNQQGTRSLIAESLNVDKNSTKKMTYNECNLHLLISKHISRLTDRQQRCFAETMCHLRENLNNLTNGVSEQLMRFVPTSKADIDRIYIKSTNSIALNLPRPRTRELDYHSYVYLRDIVADFLIKNKKDILTLDKWNGLIHSKELTDECKRWFSNCRSHEIVADAFIRHRNMRDDPENFETDSVTRWPTIPLFLCFWSDDFDPNKSIKANRQSVWIKTVTIKTFTSEFELISETYPVAVSEKGVDHEEVEDMLKRELNSLCIDQFEMMYSTFHRKPCYVHADVYCSKMDQPERRTSLRLFAGNSVVHARYGHLVDCKQMVDKIRSCGKCSKSIESEHFDEHSGKNAFWRSGKCQNCTSWMISPTNPLLSFKVTGKDAKHYPKEMFDGADETLLPKKINLTDMYVSAILVHSNVTDINLNGNHWSRIQCSTYLRYSGFNAKTSNEIVNKSFNIKHLNYLQNSNLAKDKVELEKVIRDKTENPENYEPFQKPSSWYHFNDLKVFVDVPMHLLFLGIVKTVTLNIGAWLKSFRAHSPFVSKINEVLDPIQKLNLSWCKIRIYSEDRFGGWVSENYLALCRLSLWLYSCFDCIPLNDKVDCDPTHVIKMIYFMHSMISKCMTCHRDTENDVEFLEATIRCFCIYYDTFERSLSDSEVPGWISSYNFLSLLNLPETLRHYGCMRPLWEGGTDGESYLKTVKREVKCGLRRNWKLWLIENLLKEKTFNQLLTTNIQYNQQDVREYKVYQNKETIKKLLKTNKAISGFRIHDGTVVYYYVTYRNKNDISAIKVNIKNEDVITRNYETYRKVILSTKEFKENDIVNNKVGCLFLPYLMTGEKPQYYSVIASDWI